MKKPDWWHRFFRRESSSEIAKRRLKFVLMSDRLGVDQETMEHLKKELIVVLSRYFEINQSELEVDLHREDESVALVANIPIMSMKVRPGAQIS